MKKEGAKTKLCLLRDIFKIIKDFEIDFQKKHDLCLNEGMTLCSLKEGKKSASELAEQLGLSASNMSKVIRSVEDKGFVDRIMGDEDKRQMYFILNTKGMNKLNALRCEEESLESILNSIYATNQLELVDLP